MEKTLYEIAKGCNTDKYIYGYTTVYADLFEKMRNEPIKILEIGICDGCSLRTWEQYFLNADIYGIDAAEAGCMHTSGDFIRSLNIGRMHTFIADQNDRNQLQAAMNYFNTKFDIILDDGHHFQSPQQVSWGFLWDYLKGGGIYIIEDIITPWDLSHGNDWGQRDKRNLTDCTAYVVENFIKNGKVNSPYIKPSEISSLEQEIREAKLYYPCVPGPLGGPCDPTSPVTGTSILGVILKK